MNATNSILAFVNLCRNDKKPTRQDAISNLALIIANTMFVDEIDDNEQSKIIMGLAKEWTSDHDDILKLIEEANTYLMNEIQKHRSEHDGGCSCHSHS